MQGTFDRKAGWLDSLLDESTAGTCGACSCSCAAASTWRFCQGAPELLTDQANQGVHGRCVPRLLLRQAGAFRLNSDKRQTQIGDTIRSLRHMTVKRH